MGAQFTEEIASPRRQYRAEMEGVGGGWSRAFDGSLYGGQYPIRKLVLRDNYGCGDKGHPIKDISMVLGFGIHMCLHATT